MDLIDAVLQVLRTDREMRRQSWFGQSQMQKRNAVCVGVLCALLIAGIVVLCLWLGF